MEESATQNFLEAQFPFIRDDVFLLARVDKVTGKQLLVIRQVDPRSGKILQEARLECIHAALAEISPDELEEFRTDSEAKAERISSLVTENLGQVDLSINERFHAFKSWVAGISEAGMEAFQLQAELEGALRIEVPIAGFLMGFFARIDPGFLPTQFDYIERASWNEGTRQEAFLIANLLPILDILALETQIVPYKDEILELIMDLQPPLDLFLEADCFLPFLLNPKALPIIEKGISKTGLFAEMPANDAALKFVQEIASYELYYGVPLVQHEFLFLEKLKVELGINFNPLDDEQWHIRSGFRAKFGHITKLVINLSDRERQVLGNEITKLPPEIMQLTSLKSLYLNEKMFSALPVEIHKWIIK